jgi:hypothetical protein
LTALHDVIRRLTLDYLHDEIGTRLKCIPLLRGVPMPMIDGRHPSSDPVLAGLSEHRPSPYEIVRSMLVPGYRGLPEGYLRGLSYSSRWGAPGWRATGPRGTRSTEQAKGSVDAWAPGPFLALHPRLLARHACSGRRPLCGFNRLGAAQTELGFSSFVGVCLRPQHGHIAGWTRFHSGMVTGFPIAWRRL